jgi:hypothetical protein
VVEFIPNPEQAKVIVKEWLSKNPGFEWRGEWKTATP